MRTYIEQKDGSLISDGETFPPKWRFTVDAEVAAGDSEITAYVAPSQASIDAALLIANSKKYLAETDWMVIREAEKGTAIPQDVKDLRDQARIDANEV